VTLLEEAGYEGFNTNAIAGRAGVNVATVYRYFPDKFAVVRALATQLEAERADRVIELLQDFDSAADWRASVRQIVIAVMTNRRTQPGAIVVRRALQASPELLSIDRAATARLIEALAAALERRRPAIDAIRVRLVSTVAVVGSAAVLDHAWDRPDQTDALVEEASAMVVRYLEPELE
jgi:AcrR family transcriptional regulator